MTGNSSRAIRYKRGWQGPCVYVIVVVIAIAVVLSVTIAHAKTEMLYMPGVVLDDGERHPGEVSGEEHGGVDSSKDTEAPAGAAAETSGYMGYGLPPNEPEPVDRWATVSGWSSERPLPIRYKDDPETGERRPVEPGFIVFNDLVGRYGVRPYRTTSREPHVAVPVEGGFLTFPLPGGGPDPLWRFREYAANRFFTEHGYSPPSTALRIAERVLTDRALRLDLARERVVDLYLRTAPHGRYGSRIDLGDETGRFVTVDSTGWRIESAPVPTFARKLHQQPLPEPADVPAEEVARFWRYVPIPSRDERLLLLTALVERLLPWAPKPILLFVGPEGSTKSSEQRIVMDVVDPSRTRDLALRTDPRDLQHHLRTFATLSYDNVSRIEDEVADLLCSIVTGSSINERKLYTNSDESVSSPTPLPLVLINGIDVPTSRPDFLDRSVFLHCESPKHRLGEDDLAEAWKADHPAVLGGLLALTSRVLARLEMNELPPVASRMQVFARVGLTVGREIGLTDTDFMAAYELNRAEKTAQVAIEEWFRHILAFLEARTHPTPSDTAETERRADEAIEVTFEASEVAAWIENKDPGFRARHHITDLAKAAGTRITRLIAVLGERGYRITTTVGTATKTKLYTARRLLDTGLRPPSPDGDESRPGSSKTSNNQFLNSPEERSLTRGDLGSGGVRVVQADEAEVQVDTERLGMSLVHEVVSTNSPNIQNSPNGNLPAIGTRVSGGSQVAVPGVTGVSRPCSPGVSRTGQSKQREPEPYRRCKRHPDASWYAGRCGCPSISPRTGKRPMCCVFVAVQPFDPTVDTDLQVEPGDPRIEQWERDEAP